MNTLANRNIVNGYGPDPMLPKYTDKCQCTTCGEYFNSTFAFDFHREEGLCGRRCLTTQEMMDKGMGKSKTGHWISSEMDSDARG